MTREAILSIEDLRVCFRTLEGTVQAVKGVSFELREGEILGVVGESGSGKSVSCLAAMGLLDRNAVESIDGRIIYRGEDILRAREARLRRLRGDRLSMVFQDPKSALNPFLTIGTQMAEVGRFHRGLSWRAAKKEAASVLGECGIDRAAEFLARRPHELSGGQRQRVMIATALLLRPDILFCDEPTTALDVTTQARILELIADVCRKRGTSVIFISHDLAVVAGIADRVVVMHRGDLVEEAETAELFASPNSAHTRELLDALPRIDSDVRPPPVADKVSDRPLLSVRDLMVAYGRGRHAVQVVHGVDFDVFRGEVVALVGESGSGKSTILRAVAGLHPASGGSVVFDGIETTGMSERALKPLRRRYQMVFQDPYGSLNPRMTVGRIVTEPLVIHGWAGRRADLDRRARELLADVEIPPDAINRYPHAFSGGQRQRIAIARALALEPELILLDEAVSALDVSVQAKVLELLAGLSETRGIAYLFVTHDLAVVREIAHRVVVLHKGRIVECGPTQDVLDDPRDPYTQTLRAAVPRPIPRWADREGKAV